MVSETNELGHVTTFGYDAAGRRTSVTDALGHVTLMAYDDAGQLTTVTDALGHVTSYAYDPAGRQTKITYADGRFESTGYDLAGNRTSKTDQAGIVTTYGYDLLGRLTTVTDALGQITSYGYDELGQKVTQTDSNAHTTKYAYDALGRRVSRTLPLGQTETTVYDVAGRVASKVDFNGKTTTFGYDAVDRLVTRTPDPSFVGEVAVTWTYTATGRRATMTDGTGTTTYGYDARDRLLTKATPYGALTYTRDAMGHVKTVRSDQTDGVAVDYGWDDTERLATVTDGFDAKVTTYGYDSAGRLLGWVQPNGVATSFTYDTANHLKDVTVKNAASSVLASYAYTLGPTGNRLGVVEKSGRTIAWTYEALYRLESETISGSASANGAISYTYDPVGNRLTRSSTVSGVPSTTTTYDANDRTVGDTWNDNGNMLTREGRSQGFDSLDRLVSSSGSGGAVKVTYDGDGNRVSQEVGGVVTTYLVDDQNPTGYAQVVEERVAGAVAKAYVYGKKPLSQRAKSGATWTTSYYGMDGHGSVTLLTDGAGAVTDTWEYEAFGTVVARTGTTANTILFSGERWDDVQKTYHLRAREYDPLAGRFLSADTFEGDETEPTTLSRYPYALDPVNNVDPSGHTSIQDAMTTAYLMGQNFIRTYPLTAAAMGLAANALLPVEFHEALIGTHMPGFEQVGMVGRGEARAIQAIKSDAGKRLVRWVEQFGGIAKKRLEGHVSRGVGLWFEEFVERYMIPGARKLDDKLGIGDYIWKEMIVEVKSGAISAEQLARVAAHAAKEKSSIRLHLPQQTAGARRQQDRRRRRHGLLPILIERTSDEQRACRAASGEAGVVLQRPSRETWIHARAVASEPQAGVSALGAQVGSRRG